MLALGVGLELPHRLVHTCSIDVACEVGNEEAIHAVEATCKALAPNEDDGGVACVGVAVLVDGELMVDGGAVDSCEG